LLVRLSYQVEARRQLAPAKEPAVSTPVESGTPAPAV